MISLGIDTGGTFTDAVAFDHATGTLLAKGKSPTTKEDLSIGILGALRSLPSEVVARADAVILSTTLATNACVENKGGKAKLLLLGSSASILKRVDAERTYGLKPDDVLCVETKRTYDGTEVEIPRWDELLASNAVWFSDIEALAVAEMYSYNTGAVCEKSAREYFGEMLEVPVVLASEIVSDINVIERGATALLNARLLVVIEEFLEAVFTSAGKEKIPAHMMIVRSDGSLMSVPLAAKVPVETILSGPAASTVGGMYLSKADNCVIVDMGGTTTDLSIVKDGKAKLTDTGIRIGGWATQIKGVYVDTFALGGDSMIRIEADALALGSERILPICLAAKRWPGIKDELKRLLKSEDVYYKHSQEVLCLIKEPEDLTSYLDAELKLISILKQGPKMIRHIILNDRMYESSIRTERLEAEGVIIRAGLTPTDMMHLRGDYDSYDTEASQLLARFFMSNLEDYKNASVEDFAEAVYDEVSKKLYGGIVKALLADRFESIAYDGTAEQTDTLIEESWNSISDNKVLGLRFSSPLALVGVGAPTHLFLPRVADALGTSCILPEHAEVANALGSALAEIRVEVIIRVSPIIENESLLGYRVFTPEGGVEFDALGPAKEFALKTAEEVADAQARERGAQGKVLVTSEFRTHDFTAKDGTRVSYDLHAWALARSEDSQLSPL